MLTRASVGHSCQNCFGPSAFNLRVTTCCISILLIPPGQDVTSSPGPSSTMAGRNNSHVPPRSLTNTRYTIPHLAIHVDRVFFLLEDLGSCLSLLLLSVRCSPSRVDGLAAPSFPATGSPYPHPMESGSNTLPTHPPTLMRGCRSSLASGWLTLPPPNGVRCQHVLQS